MCMLARKSNRNSSGNSVIHRFGREVTGSDCRKRGYFFALRKSVYVDGRNYFCMSLGCVCEKHNKLPKMHVRKPAAYTCTNSPSKEMQFAFKNLSLTELQTYFKVDKVSNSCCPPHRGAQMRHPSSAAERSGFSRAPCP